MLAVVVVVVCVAVIVIALLLMSLSRWVLPYTYFEVNSRGIQRQMELMMMCVSVSE
jgi:hypothetical protein